MSVLAVVVWFGIVMHMQSVADDATRTQVIDLGPPQRRRSRELRSEIPRGALVLDQACAHTPIYTTVLCTERCAILPMYLSTQYLNPQTVVVFCVYRH